MTPRSPSNVCALSLSQVSSFLGPFYTEPALPPGEAWHSSALLHPSLLSPHDAIPASDPLACGASSHTGHQWQQGDQGQPQGLLSW